jgi:hypothetical protein
MADNDSGSLCGATFVDQDFETFLKSVFPDGPKRWDIIEPEKRRKMLNNEWEHGIKPDFDGTNGDWDLDLFVGHKRVPLTMTS